MKPMSKKQNSRFSAMKRAKRYEKTSEYQNKQYHRIPGTVLHMSGFYRTQIRQPVALHRAVLAKNQAFGGATSSPRYSAPRRPFAAKFWL